MELREGCVVSLLKVEKLMTDENKSAAAPTPPPPPEPPETRMVYDSSGDGSNKKEHLKED